MLSSVVCPTQYYVSRYWQNHWSLASHSWYQQDSIINYKWVVLLKQSLLSESIQTGLWDAEWRDVGRYYDYAHCKLEEWAASRATNETAVHHLGYVLRSQLQDSRPLLSISNVLKFELLLEKNKLCPLQSRNQWGSNENDHLFRCKDNLLNGVGESPLLMWRSEWKTLVEQTMHVFIANSWAATSKWYNEILCWRHRGSNWFR